MDLKDVLRRHTDYIGFPSKPAMINDDKFAEELRASVKYRTCDTSEEEVRLRAERDAYYYKLKNPSQRERFIKGQAQDMKNSKSTHRIYRKWNDHNKTQTVVRVARCRDCPEMSRCCGNNEYYCHRTGGSIPRTGIRDDCSLPYLGYELDGPREPENWREFTVQELV